MKLIKNNIPITVMILFEVVGGILMLISPQLFTNLVVIIFGILMLIIGIVYLTRYLKERKAPVKNTKMNLVIAIVALIIGIICTFLSRWVVSLFALIAIVFGIMMIINGIFKIKTYSDAKKVGDPKSRALLVSAVLSLIFGVIIVINPFSAVNALWIFLGIALLVEAAVDIASLASGRS